MSAHLANARLCLAKLKVLEGHTVSVVHWMLHQKKNDELVTEEDFFRLEQFNRNKLLKHVNKPTQEGCFCRQPGCIRTMRSGEASYGSQDTKLDLLEIYINVKLDRSPLSIVTKVEPLENSVHKTFTVSCGSKVEPLSLHRGCPHGSHDERQLHRDMLLFVLASATSSIPNRCTIPGRLTAIRSSGP